MEEIKVGDFIRTRKGIIGKVEQIGNSLLWIEDGTAFSLQDKSIKHSKNIIDLIEEGDYVNGNKVIRIETSSYPEDKNVKIIVCCGDDDYYVYYNEDIKSIVTKEQFENNVYRIGD